MAFSKYIEYSNQHIPEIMRVFSNVVIYDHLKHRDLIKCYLKKEISINNYEFVNRNKYHDILDIDNKKEKDILVSKIKDINQRICEISNSVYKNSNLSSYIQYSEVSSDLIIAVKSMFILSMSKANPKKLMIERVNEFLSASSQDFIQRKKSTYDICRMAIYFSVFSPDYLSKNKGDVKKSVYGTKGGRDLINKVSGEMDYLREAGKKKSSPFGKLSFSILSRGFYRKISGY